MSNAIPSGWKDDGTTLTAPSGHKVVRGFRDHVLGGQWDADNWPLEDEQGLAHVELALNSGSGTRQIFRTKMLVWYGNRGVVEAWVGAELMAALGEVAALQKQAQQPATTDQTTIAALEMKLTQIVKIANE